MSIRTSALATLAAALAMTTVTTYATLTTTPAAAATTTTDTSLLPTDDTDVIYERPTLTNGSSTLLRAGYSSGETKETYIKFNLVTLPANTTINRVTLRLTRASEPLPASIFLWTVSSNKWTEATLNAGNRPSHASLVRAVQPTSTAASVDFDVTSVVKSSGIYAFSLTAPNGLARLQSKEAGAAGPKLLINTTTTTTASPTPSPTRTTASPTPSPTRTTATPTPTQTQQQCTVNSLLVPSCGLLWGTAFGYPLESTKTQALRDFEEKTGRTQHIFHAYHRGADVFPNSEEIAIARESGKKRILMLNYNPTSYSDGRTFSWAQIAAGEVDPQLDKIAANIKTNFPEKFFLVIHHEPEEEVRQTEGSGWTAQDYAAMYRHVIQRLRAGGVTNAITVMAYMSYEPWNKQPWFDSLYPGDDVVDWIGWDAYAQSDPGQWAYGDFTEMMNRSAYKSTWPGLYAYSERRFPNKPLMLAEWGVWYSDNDPNHQSDFYKSVQSQIGNFPRLKAMVYFDTPCDQRCYNSRVDQTANGLESFKQLGSQPIFQVKID